MASFNEDFNELQESQGIRNLFQDLREIKAIYALPSESYQEIIELMFKVWRKGYDDGAKMVKCVYRVGEYHPTYQALTKSNEQEGEQ